MGYKRVQLPPGLASVGPGRERGPRCRNPVGKRIQLLNLVADFRKASSCIGVHLATRRRTGGTLACKPAGKQRPRLDLYPLSKE